MIFLYVYFLNPQELETRQQRAVHGLREGQLTKQHQTELGNQVLLVSDPYRVFHTTKKTAPPPPPRSSLYGNKKEKHGFTLLIIFFTYVFMRLDVKSTSNIRI
jgi:hypothetical protein